MDDLEFVQRCAQGQKAAWDEFVKRYSRLIYNYIFYVLRGQSQKQEAADIFQEIFYSLTKDNFHKLKSFKGKNGCSLASWLRQVTINSTFNYLRDVRPAVSLEAKSRDDERGLMDFLADNAKSQREILFKKDGMDNLKECVETLELDDKYFLELHINQGLSLERLSVALRISRAAVDMRKFRILERLKNCFKKKGFTLD